jgi:hypothetical protein
MEEIMRQAINEAANQLIKELRGKSLTPPLRISRVGVNWYDDTSCYVSVATFGEDRPLVQVWYDHSLDDNRPAFWVGFGAEDRTRIDGLLRDCSSEFPSPIEFPVNDWDEQQGRLRDEALQRVLAAPIAEFYGELNGFGIYGTPGRDTLDLPKASDFIERVLRSLPEFRAMEILRDIKAIESDRKISETEREALIKARVGQGRFRAELEAVWDNKCAVSGYLTRELLRASHIKPWRESAGEERLDPNNGLLLAAHLDALFDAGLISFRDDGSMMISDRIDSDEREQLKLGGVLRNLRKEPWAALNKRLSSGETVQSTRSLTPSVGPGSWTVQFRSLPIHLLDTALGRHLKSGQS